MIVVSEFGGLTFPPFLKEFLTNISNRFEFIKLLRRNNTAYPLSFRRYLYYSLRYQTPSVHLSRSRMDIVQEGT